MRHSSGTWGELGRYLGAIAVWAAAGLWFPALLSMWLAPFLTVLLVSAAPHRLRGRGRRG